MTNLPEIADWVKSLVPDLEARVDAFRVDTEFLDEELLEAFKEEIAQQSELMKAGAQNDNPDEIRAAAHSVKGMGGTIGLPEISVLAQEIESRAKNGDVDGCKFLVSEFVSWAVAFVAS